MQQPLIIQKLFRKNNAHKNLGLCCSALLVQGQEYLLLLLSFFFNPLSLSFFVFFLSQPYSLSLFLFLSLNLINSFSSYQDGIRQKRLYLEAGEKSFLQMYLSGLYYTIAQLGEKER